ncbi:MAG TPA: DNA topoisomerase IB [Chitinophagaceae bacterium]|nr:DNA topoisomerase IB [Chitinophagaceae bacterium]
MKTSNGFNVPKRKLKGLLQNTEKSAEVINLVYVSDKEPGIERSRQGKNFIYTKKGKKITGKSDLLRIRRLVLPPAWENVWICSLSNGHLQATGFDVKRRKQYKYHSLWSEFRNQTKFYQLLEFGKKLPAIRERLAKDLSKPGLPLEKVLAASVMIMQETNMRVGNEAYEKLYGSFGLTTLKDRHVKINGSSVKFCFKGKKGIYHEVDLKSAKLARIVKQCRDIPGKELFQYYNEDGDRRSIDSGMVNEYIKNICCDNFTAKDFRTWTGSVYAIEALKELGCCDDETEKKKRTVQALDTVAKRLGNTRAVCKKYYIHPIIEELYSSGKLETFFQTKANTARNQFSEAEHILMQILENS